MHKQLPVRASLEHLKAQAKDLLASFRRKEPEALTRFRDSLPAAAGATNDALASMKLALHDAQSVVAREYGFSSWAELRAHVVRAPAGPTPELLRALMAPHLGVTLPAELQRDLLAAASAAPAPMSIESPLPLLPVRNAVLVVGAVAPFNIGRASSIAAVDAARQGGEALAVFAQRNDTTEAPTEADFHPVGCAARLVSTLSTPDRGSWIVVRAMEWIHMESIDDSRAYLQAKVTRFEVRQETSSDVEKLERTLRERVRSFAARLPDAEHLLQMTERMTALELADAAIANLPCSVQDKARYASEPSLLARLEYVVGLFDRAA